MKKTILYDQHVAQGARMEEFGGFEMPIQFDRIHEEHMAVRSRAGIFDVSHMGEILISGKGAISFLEKITTNHVGKIKIGQAQYTLMTNPEGGIIDDLLLYRLDENEFLMVVNAGNTDKNWDWIIENKSYDTETKNISSERGIIALQGPKAGLVLKKLTSAEIDRIPSFYFQKAEVAGVENVLISATGYTGSGGFELYTEVENMSKLWASLMDAGSSVGMVQAGLGARDTLRLEMGYPLYGQDIDENTNPLEAGLGWVVKLTKEDFIGKEAIAEQKRKGLVKILKGFVLPTKRVPREGHILCDSKQNQIGKVTSGTLSPCLEKSIGMGYIDAKKWEEGMEILVFNGKKYFEGHLTKIPFVNVKDYVS